MLCAGRPRWQEEHNRPLFLISLPVCQTTSHRRCYNCRFWPLIPTRYAHLASIPSCLLPTITQDSVWHHYRLSYEIDVQIKNWQAVARSWGDVAVTYHRLGEYQKAIDNSEQALDRNERIGFRRGVALNHVRLAESYLRLSNFDKALFHAEQACKNLQHLAPFDRKLV